MSDSKFRLLIIAGLIIIDLMFFMDSQDSIFKRYGEILVRQLLMVEVNISKEDCDRLYKNNDTSEDH